MESESSVDINARERDNLTAAEGTRPGRVITPAVDIYENPDTITLLADMPGVTADELTIDLHEGILTITGHARPPETEQETDVVREYRVGTFQRKFTLSETIDQARIGAQLFDGVLHLQLPKVAQAKARKIEIKTS